MEKELEEGEGGRLELKSLCERGRIAVLEDTVFDFGGVVGGGSEEVQGSFDRDLEEARRRDEG